MDFSSRDLSFMDLSGANLRGANLKNANVFLANFSGAVLDGAVASGMHNADWCLTATNFKNSELFFEIVRNIYSNKRSNDENDIKIGMREGNFIFDAIKSINNEIFFEIKRDKFFKFEGYKNFHTEIYSTSNFNSDNLILNLNTDRDLLQLYVHNFNIQKMLNGNEYKDLIISTTKIKYNSLIREISDVESAIISGIFSKEIIQYFPSTIINLDNEIQNDRFYYSVYKLLATKIFKHYFRETLILTSLSCESMIYSLNDVTNEEINFRNYIIELIINFSIMTKNKDYENKFRTAKLIYIYKTTKDESLLAHISLNYSESTIFVKKWIIKVIKKLIQKIADNGKLASMLAAFT